jgi:hypothetical protein
MVFSVQGCGCGGCISSCEAPCLPCLTMNANAFSCQIPISFSTPPNAVAAALVATITGHGMDSQACGEFCAVSHHFRLNGKVERVINFDSAATLFGCADGSDGANGLLYGQAPNQYGTVSS